MKHIFTKLVPFLLFSFFATSNSFAIVVTVGTDTSTHSWTYPINRYYNYSASEQIYLSSEIGMSGTINKISFQKSVGIGGTASIDSIKIYIKETAVDTAMATTSLTGYTLAYSGAFPNNLASGWAGVMLSSPFNYSGTQHLSILIINAQPDASNHPYYNMTSTVNNNVPMNRTSFYKSGTIAWSNTGTMEKVHYRANIQLDITGPCSGTVTAGTISGPSAPICKNAAAFTLTAIGQTTGMGIKYQWKSRAAGTTSLFTGLVADTLGTLVNNVTTSTEYRLYASCQYTGIKDSSAIFTVTVASLPAKPVITKTGFTLSVPNIYTTYQWYKNNTIITGATNNSNTATANGFYFVKVTNSTACVNYSDTVNVTTVNVPGITSDFNAIVIHPNPARDKVFIDVANPVNVLVMDLQGRKLLEVKNTKEVNMSGMANGVYMFIITDENNNVKREKIILEKN